MADEIEADKRALEGIMDDLGFGADRAKNLVLWAAEKAGPAQAQRPAHGLLAALAA